MARSGEARRQRKSAFRQAMDAILALSDEELKNMQAELGRQIGQHIGAANALRLRLDAVKTERQRRVTGTSVPGVRVSDHAVVRYLERCRGVDVRQIREEIAAIATRADRVEEGRRGRRVDAASGLTIGTDETTNIVTTVFTPAELPILDLAMALEGSR